MYQPPHFKETRPEILHGLIRAHPLGLLVCNGPQGPIANPIPFLLDTPEGQPAVLRAHLSKANPAWRVMGEQPDTPVLVVFQGPQAYVTPSWYETKKQTGKVVPTWNYAIVQVRGPAEIIDDRDWLRAQIEALTGRHESGRAAAWQVGDAPENFIEAQMKGIIGLRIKVEAIEGKWKVSQNRPVEDRAGVAKGYRDERNDAMAGLVRDYGGIEG
ncbi:FMN-binding negative transcriptional regulator [Nitratireductor thuwali]|uniref:Protease synthase and sporulation protein PAI 2 n=1 Tax=Nitratireductor thuwali TaxID=2267699 RepID=A0ABY5MR69_9HYPH|nr:Protease synthase and sporulation protein PAI 2 [Nitratireductor thuwali]